MSATDKYLPRYTYHDYIQWEGRWELIEGHPIAMSPMPLPKHQHTNGRLYRMLAEAMEENCGQCNVYLPLAYRISDDTIVQPDLLIVCEPIKKAYLDFAPELVVEILSPSTMLRDRNTKHKLYEQQGIGYYLVVDADKKQIEIYKLVAGNYILEPGGTSYTFTLRNGCKLPANFDAVW